MSKPEAPSISVESCRKCDYQYNFILPNGKTVTVLCGQPSGVEYKAVSYLWQNTKPLNLKCKRCSATKAIPVRDAQKLWHILEFVRGGSKIWLDALSIDQDDPKDLAAQLALMGDIYRDAAVVSVMLPAEDKESYEILKDLAVTANEVVKRREEFGMELPGVPQPTQGSERTATTEELAARYQGLILQWGTSTSKWNYWSRAWTFQEWTMAAEIEIAWEGIPNNGGLQNIKNVIVSASSIIGHWRMLRSKSSTRSNLVTQAAERAEVSTNLNLVRMHFPFQDFLIADDAEDLEGLRKRTMLTPIHSISSGTSVEIFKDGNKTHNLRRLLGLALTAISISKRQARYEADLVACWASMCNIQYEYSKDDLFSHALQKVVAAIRQAGIPIFNFHAHTIGGETDLKFMEYAAAMKHNNLGSGAYMFGTPIFVGRVDTTTHFKHCLEQVEEPILVPRTFEVTLQEVGNAEVGTPVPMKDKSVLTTFKGLVSGTADGQEVLDVTELLHKVVDELSRNAAEQLEKHQLVPVSVSCQQSENSWDFDTWGICASDIDTSKLFVARESLNGTLLLALPITGDQSRIVSYLFMTHQRHGTYLIKTNEKGIADIVFLRPDPFLLEALSTSDISTGPKPVDPDLMAMMNIPGLGLIDVLDEANDVALTLTAKKYHVA